MKKFLLLSILILSAHVFGQATVYNTYEEFTADSGTAYDEFTDFSHTTVTFTKDGKETVVTCKDIWGFKTKDGLWRCTKYPTMTKSFVRVIFEKNDFFYYEYGILHAAYLLGRSQYEYTLVQAHVSKGLNGEMYRVWLKGSMKGKLKKFGKENPGIQPLLDCWFKRKIKGQCTAEQARECATPFFTEE